MNKRFLQVVSLALIIPLLSGCASASPETRAGDWHAATSFGEFTLTVDSSGTTLTRAYVYVRDCNGNSFKDTIELAEDRPSSAIEKGKISLTLSIAGQLPMSKWEAEFSRDGTMLTGTWEVLGGSCSSDFEITR